MQNVEVVPGDEIDLKTITLEREPPPLGLVNLFASSSEKDTVVYVDGILVGKLPAIAQLEAGRHVFRVVAPSGSNYSLDREVEFTVKDQAITIDLTSP